MSEKIKRPKYTSLGLLETPMTGMTSDSSDAKSTDVRNISRRTTSTVLASSFIPSTSDSSRAHRLKQMSSSTSSTNLRTPRSGRYTSDTRTPLSRHTPTSRSTPYTTSSATPAHHDSSVYVAVVEGRGMAKGEIGMACFDLKNPVLQLSQFSDGPAYLKVITKLRILDPLEVVMSNTTCEVGHVTQLYQLLTTHSLTITTVQRKYFNETSGLQYIKDLVLPENQSLLMEITSKYYCLAATAALLKYIEFIQNTVFASSSIKVVFKGSDQTTMIDAATVKNLELLVNLRDPKSSHTLYGMMNYTQTVSGSRLLRSNILQPPCDMETISQRQDAVTELLENEQLFHQIHSVIGRFMDIGHLLSACVQINKKETVKTAENKLSSVIHLKHTLELITPLQEAVSEAMSPLFRGFAKHLEDAGFSQMLGHVNSAIRDDTRWEKGAANMCIQKCFAVKPKINGLLDISRQSHSEMVDDISNMIKQLSEEYNLPLKMRYNTLRGYYIQLTHSHKDSYTTHNLPPVFIKVRRQKTTLTFITADLIKMNDRIQQSLHEIYMMSDLVISELLGKLREHMACLYKLTECVAVLDMLVSFAYACTISDYVRPEFTDTLAIKQGRHPILDKIGSDPPVPNNIYASDDGNFLIITGPNMSGKSTYLRQVALTQIVAQCGSYVPAQYASLRLTNQIFSRLGSDDDLETNASTFYLEMKEANYIVRNATDKSLIIIDELGRGTSVGEGMAISHAICEHLLKLKAFTFFVTHFLDLSTLPTLYPNVQNYHFEVQRIIMDTDADKVIYTHVLSKGRSREQHYGLQLAAVSTMPKSVIEKAHQMVTVIASHNQNDVSVTSEQKTEHAAFKLANKLVQVARNSRLDEDSLRQYLQTLKAQYTLDVNA